MKILRNNILPVKGYEAMYLFGILFVRKDAELTPDLLNHELIHAQQCKELWHAAFYTLYVIFYLYALLRYLDTRKAYHMNPFEREAYTNMNVPDYIKHLRKPFAWRQYISAK